METTMATGILHLPPELLCAILDQLDDRTFWACRLAHRGFHVTDGDALEKRIDLWRGCRTAVDFSARGNVEALTILCARSRVGDPWRCVYKAASNGHVGVLIFLHERGLLRDGNVIVASTWRIHAVAQAAKNGHVKALACLAQMGPVNYGHVVEGACDTDRLDVFLWACEARGRPPSLHDVKGAAFCGAFSILAHCRSVVEADWGKIVHRALRSDRVHGADSIPRILIDDPGSHRGGKIARAACRHVKLGVAKWLYGRYPAWFDVRAVLVALYEGSDSVATWLCRQRPEWADEAAEHVTRGDTSYDHFTSKTILGILWYENAIGDLARVVFAATAMANLEVLRLVLAYPEGAPRRFGSDIEHDCYSNPEYDWKDRERDDPLPVEWVHWRDGLAAPVKMALLQGALARFCDRRDPDMLDWLDRRGFSARLS
ncbi:F-box domain containing protein [Pandoravirus salinus]|uniref:F-box domain containing protein n=1 Tax=Pandoravirus salinus TaxID=1349410 RepID=S4W3K7_9VIRU|nr:F-box domain [Pandoravirus salinus]AGO85247.1 F-box domain containing protein [Pandoravirus salinus]